MPDAINILGYSGSHISLIFETLTRLEFPGKVCIVMHDDTRYFDVPFETGLPYSVIKQSDLNSIPAGAFFFCSNNPANKTFLFSFFARKWKMKESAFASIVHPSSVIASTVKHKQGLYVEPLSVISAYASVGFGVSINRHCSVGHHNVLHDYCSIYPGSHLAGDVEVGRAATIGPGTTVFSGVAIGENTIVGGGSVVTKDLPANVLAFGSPCRVQKQLTPDREQSTIL